MKAKKSSNSAMKRRSVAEANNSLGTPLAQTSVRLEVLGQAQLTADERAYLGSLEGLFLSSTAASKRVLPKPRTPKALLEHPGEAAEDFALAELEPSDNLLDQGLLKLNDFNELRLFWRDSNKLVNSFKPQASALGPLVYRPDFSTPVWQATAVPVINALLPLTNNPLQPLILASTGLSVKLVSNYIPSFLGFSQSPILLRPARSLESLVAHSTLLASSYSALPNAQALVTTVLSAANCTINNSLKANLCLIPQTSFKAFNAYYQWNPRAARVEQFTSSLQEPADHLHYLVSRGLAYVNKYGKTKLPYPQALRIQNSPAVHDAIYSFAALKGLKESDFPLVFNSFKAAGSFKILKDLNLFGFKDVYSVLAPAHLAIGGFAVTPAIFDFSKNLMELYKHSGFISKPFAALSELVSNNEQDSVPWSKESYKERLQAYYYLKNALVGRATEPSAFEEKMQNLFYNLMLSGEALSASSLFTGSRTGFALWHFFSNFYYKRDEYDLYFRAVERLFGSVAFSADPLRNKIFHHFFNRLIWNEFILPVCVQLPLRGLTTAILREQAETLFNNEEFLARMRLQINQLLKNTLFNPHELVQAADLEFAKPRGPNPFDKVAMKMVLGAKLAGVSAGVATKTSSLFRKQTTSLRAVMTKAVNSIRFNPRDGLINYLSACPIVRTPTASYDDALDLALSQSLAQMGEEVITGLLGGTFEQPYGDFLDEMIDDMLERTEASLPFNVFLERSMAVLDTKGLTQGRKGKSYIESLTSFISYPLISIWHELRNNPQAIKARIKQAKSFAELASLAELERVLRAYTTEEDEVTTALCLDEEEFQAYLLPFKQLHEAKSAQLKARLELATKERAALGLRYQVIYPHLIDETSREFSPEQRQEFKQFQDELERVIAEHKDYADASDIISSLHGVLAEFKQLFKLKEHYCLKNLSFNLFLTYLKTAACNNHEALAGLRALVAERSQEHPQSQLLLKVQAELASLQEEHAPVDVFIERCAAFREEILRLHSHFIVTKNNNSLSTEGYRQLTRTFNELLEAYKHLELPAKSEFFAAVDEGLNLSFAQFKQEIAALEKALAAQESELEPLMQLFEKMQGSTLASLPTAAELKQYRACMAQATVSSAFPRVIDEERQALLADKEEAQLKLHLLSQLDRVIEQTIAALLDKLAKNPSKGVQLLNEEENKFDAAFQPLCHEFANDAELEAKRSQFNEAMRRLHRSFDATGEITKRLGKELTSYLAALNKASSLPLKARLTGFISPFSYAQVVQLSELCTPYLALHGEECRQVFKQAGLPMTERADCLQALAAYSQQRILSLIDEQLDKALFSSLKGNEDLAHFYKGQEQLFLTPELCAFFKDDKQVIQQHCAQYFEPTKLLTKYLNKLTAQIEASRALISNKSSKSWGLSLFAKRSLTQQEFDTQMQQLLSSLTQFEPAEYRPQVIAAVNEQLKTPEPSPQSGPH